MPHPQCHLEQSVLSLLIRNANSHHASISKLMCFKMYTGFVLIEYAKVTDVETTAFERRVYCLQSPRGMGTSCRARPHGEARGRRRE